jgi:hypothetical protein
MATKLGSEHHERAIGNVARAHAIIARQLEIIRKMSSRQGDCSEAEGLLALFERSLAISRIT